MNLPTAATVHELRSTITPILNEIRQNYGEAIAEPLSAALSGSLCFLERTVAENDERHVQLLEQRLALGKAELQLLKEEQMEFCNKCDRDIDYAVTQWKQERSLLRNSIHIMNDQLQTLSAIFNRTNSVLRLHHPFVSEKYQDSQDKYVKQLSETILKLQERWEDKSADLEELHREIDDGFKDFQTLRQLLADRASHGRTADARQ